MKIDLYNNSQIRNFKEELEDRMQDAKCFDIATAFITDEAIDVIDIFLNKNKNQQRIGRLITGFYHCFNSKEVLIKLQELVEKLNGRLLVNMSKNEGFHWKYYHFENRNEEIYYIGSANFTGKGMGDKGELVLKLSLSYKDKSDKENFRNIFNKEFENSIDITKIPIEDYEQSKSAKASSKGLPLSIRNILNSQEKEKPSKKEVTSMQVIFLKGYLSAKTIKIIKEKKSNWVDYYPCYRKSDYKSSIKADLLFIIEYYGRKYSFRIAKRIDECKIHTTDDGDYFIAYKVIRKINKETDNIKNELNNIGLDYHSHSFSEKALRNRQTKQLLSLFNYNH